MRLTLINKKQESDNVWSFFFDTDKLVSWWAGQSIRLEIPRSTFGYDERRFSISSALHEQHIRITTRISDSEFKQNLGNLDLNTQIDGHNIEGNFVWDNSSKPKVFVAAGIGITPFRAMLSQAVVDDTLEDVTLIYGSSDKRIVFYEELDGWALANPALKVRYVNSRITPETIMQVAPNLDKSIIYISGPSAMVSDLSKKLTDVGISADKIRLDLFTGKIS